MSISFTGILNGIDYYNKIIVIVDDPFLITNKINDIKNPYKFLNNDLECYLIPIKHKEYYISLAQSNRYKKVNVIASIKRYCFNGKKGTSLLLKQLNIIDI